MIKQFFEVKESQKGQFRGVRRNDHIWQPRFIDIAHSQPLAEPLESVKTFIMVEDQSVVCTDIEEAKHRLKLRNSRDFSVPKENILAVTRHMLTGDRKFRKSSDCDGKSKPSCRRLLFWSIISNGRHATERVDDIHRNNELDTP
jgi:hypothetical protein